MESKTDSGLTPEQHALEQICRTAKADILLNSLSQDWQRIGLRKIVTYAEKVPIDASDVTTIVLHKNPQEIKVATKQGISVNLRPSGNLNIIPFKMDVTCELPMANEATLIALNPLLFETILEEYGQGYSLEILPSFFTNDLYIERTMRQLTKELENSNVAGRLFAESTAQLLALHLIRNHSNLGQNKPIPSSRRPPVAQLARAEEYMVAHFGEPITLSELAKVANLNMFYFAKSFREWKGKTPYRYLMELRMEKARQLLTGSKLSIEEVAYGIGFKNATNFATAFRDHFGLPPLRYRKLSQT